MEENDLERGIVVAIRRIIRAVDQHSRRLAEAHGLTGPQAVLLHELYDKESLATGELARRVHLAQGTVSEILERLEERGLVSRKRSASDQRRVEVSATPEAKALIDRKPSLLQDRFAAELRKLAPWERHFILTALERVATMMHSDELSTAPLLASTPLTNTPDVTTAILRGELPEQASTRLPRDERREPAADES